MKLLEHNLPETFETLELLPISDMHVGDPLFDSALWDKQRTWVLDAPNRYVLLNGDLLNIATKNSVSDVYTETLSPAEQLKWLKREMRPIKDRILCVTEGNHEARITRDTSIRILGQFCESLGIEELFRPEGSLLKLTFGTKAKNSKRQCYTVYMTHGRGGGALIGGKMIRMDRMSQVVLADIYVYAHSHVKAAFKQGMFVPDLRNGSVVWREQTFVNSSSLLSWGGYAEIAGYRPSAKGAPHVTLYAAEKRVEVTL